MIVLCPECQQKLKVAEEAKGKRLRCPACETIFSVPSRTVKPLKKPVPPVSSDFEVLDEDEDEDQVNETSADHEESPRQSRVKNAASTKKKKKKKPVKKGLSPALLIALGIGSILILGLGVTGVWYFGFKKEDTASTATDTKPQAKNPGWKIFDSAEFSIEIPEDMSWTEKSISQDGSAKGYGRFKIEDEKDLEIGVVVLNALQRGADITLEQMTQLFLSQGLKKQEGDRLLLKRASQHLGQPAIYLEVFSGKSKETFVMRFHSPKPNLFIIVTCDKSLLNDNDRGIFLDSINFK